MVGADAIRQRWEAVGAKLDERGRRLFAAAEAQTAGWGGLAMVSKITGLARSTINRGEDDLDAEPLPKGQVRRVGGGGAGPKKKELIGNFKNGGTDYRPKGNPQRVNVHDFEDKKLGKVVPYGVYDVTADTGFVSVGITSDTAEFAVQSIR